MFELRRTLCMDDLRIETPACEAPRSIRPNETEGERIVGDSTKVASNGATSWKVATRFRRRDCILQPTGYLASSDREQSCGYTLRPDSSSSQRENRAVGASRCTKRSDSSDTTLRGEVLDEETTGSVWLKHSRSTPPIEPCQGEEGTGKDADKQNNAGLFATIRGMIQNPKLGGILKKLAPRRRNTSLAKNHRIVQVSVNVAGDDAVDIVNENNEDRVKRERDGDICPEKYITRRNDTETNCNAARQQTEIQEVKLAEKSAEKISDSECEQPAKHEDTSDAIMTMRMSITLTVSTSFHSEPLSSIDFHQKESASCDGTHGLQSEFCPVDCVINDQPPFNDDSEVSSLLPIPRHHHSRRFERPRSYSLYDEHSLLKHPSDAGNHVLTASEKSPPVLTRLSLLPSPEKLDSLSASLPDLRFNCSHSFRIGLSVIPDARRQSHGLSTTAESHHLTINHVSSKPVRLSSSHGLLFTERSSPICGAASLPLTKQSSQIPVLCRSNVQVGGKQQLDTINVKRFFSGVTDQVTKHCNSPSILQRCSSWEDFGFHKLFNEQNEEVTLCVEDVAVSADIDDNKREHRDDVNDVVYEDIQAAVGDSGDSSSGDVRGVDYGESHSVSSVTDTSSSPFSSLSSTSSTPSTLPSTFKKELVIKLDPFDTRKFNVFRMPFEVLIPVRVTGSARLKRRASPRYTTPPANDVSDTHCEDDKDERRQFGSTFPLRDKTNLVSDCKENDPLFERIHFVNSELDTENKNRSCNVVSSCSTICNGLIDDMFLGGTEPLSPVFSPSALSSQVHDYSRQEISEISPRFVTSLDSDSLPLRSIENRSERNGNFYSRTSTMAESSIDVETNLADVIGFTTLQITQMSRSSDPGCSTQTVIEQNRDAGDTVTHKGDCSTTGFVLDSVADAESHDIYVADCTDAIDISASTSSDAFEPTYAAVVYSQGDALLKLQNKMLRKQVMLFFFLATLFIVVGTRLALKIIDIARFCSAGNSFADRTDPDTDPDDTSMLSDIAYWFNMNVVG